VRPRTNISAERDIVNLINTALAQPREHAPPVVKIRPHGRRHEQAYPHSAAQITKKTIGVILIIPRPMMARVLARAARDTFVVVDPYNGLPIRFHRGNVGLVNRADTNASIASYAFFQSVVNNFAQNFSLLRIFVESSTGDRGRSPVLQVFWDCQTRSNILYCLLLCGIAVVSPRIVFLIPATIKTSNLLFFRFFALNIEK
jgi:hypothetical protein